MGKVGALGRWGQEGLIDSTDPPPPCGLKVTAIIKSPLLKRLRQQWPKTPLQSKTSWSRSQWIAALYPN